MYIYIHMRTIWGFYKVWGKVILTMENQIYKNKDQVSSCDMTYTVGPTPETQTNNSSKHGSLSGSCVGLVNLGDRGVLSQLYCFDSSTLNETKPY